MKRFLAAFLVGFTVLASGPYAYAATVVGSATADASGQGVIEFQIDPKVDPQAAADTLQSNLSLTNGGAVKTVTVQDGVATVTFEAAESNSLVEALLSEELAKALGVGGGAGLGGLGLAGLGLLATGGLFGGLAAAGVFDGSSGGGVVSPAQ